MGRANTKNRQRKIYPWTKGSISNIGVVSTLPYDIIFHYLKDANIYEIVDLFFNNETKKINQLDQCILEQFWWIKKDILHAYYSKVEHPNHYSGEYIFDLINGERTIIDVRQPDIDGKHWKAEHIHIRRGMIDPTSVFKILNPNFNEHIELISETIKGYYIMRIDKHS